MTIKVALEQLDRPQLELLCKHQSELSDVLIAANNTMTIRLAENEDIGDRSRAVLEEWAKFLNAAIARHDQQTQDLVAVRSPTLN